MTIKFDRNRSSSVRVCVCVWIINMTLMDNRIIKREHKQTHTNTNKHHACDHTAYQSNPFKATACFSNQKEMGSLRRGGLSFKTNAKDWRELFEAKQLLVFGCFV